jgi:putative transposase
MHDCLRAEMRVKSGRHKHPTAGSLDSQSVKTTSVAGQDQGFDAGKKIKGRKRHIVVDTLGFLMAFVVTSAAVQDGDGAKILLGRLDGSAKKMRKI